MSYFYTEVDKIGCSPTGFLALRFYSKYAFQRSITGFVCHSLIIPIEGSSSISIFKILFSCSRSFLIWSLDISPHFLS